MQAVILKTTLVRDDDIIALLASKSGVFSAYRFYGARHSAILVGSHIDFELETSANFLPKIRSVLQLRYEFEQGHKHQAILAALKYGAFVRHLAKQICECEHGFYYEQLLKLADCLKIQQPTRACLDAKAKIMRAEGHFGAQTLCHNCLGKLSATCAVDERLYVYCKNCAQFNSFDSQEIMMYLKTGKSAHLSDESANALEGLFYPNDRLWP